MKFVRGVVIYHKVMGKGVVLNQIDEEKFEVRMMNGQIEHFYPEELEIEEEIKDRSRKIAKEVQAANRKRLKGLGY